MRVWVVIFAVLLALSGTGLPQEEAGPLSFEARTVDPDLGIGYAVTLADMNGDRKPDIVAVSESRVLWYENPSWREHVILDGATPRDNVAVAAADLDGDGRSELALAAHWKPSDTEKSGSVHWLVRKDDPRRPWGVVDLEPEPTAHRMRWADVDGDGKRELVMAPLHGRGNRPPDYAGAGARIVVYYPPADPASQPWKREVADGSLHVVHNLTPVRWDSDPAEEVLLASYEGVHLLERGGDGKWSRTLLVEGDQDSKPHRGTSEVRVGRLPNGDLYLATVEPWHGHQVVVYLRDSGGRWRRKVLVDSAGEAHALWCADLDGRKGDELVYGWRAPDRVSRRVGVAYFRALDAQGEKWRRTLVDDGGMACEDLAVGDLDGDGRPEIVASGRATRNVKIYWNRPAKTGS